MILLPYLLSAAYFAKLTFVDKQAFAGKLGGGIVLWRVLALFGVVYSFFLAWASGPVGLTVMSLLYAPGIVMLREREEGAWPALSAAPGGQGDRGRHPGGRRRVRRDAGDGKGLARVVPPALRRWNLAGAAATPWRPALPLVRFPRVRSTLGRAAGQFRAPWRASLTLPDRAGPNDFKTQR